VRWRSEMRPVSQILCAPIQHWNNERYRSPHSRSHHNHFSIYLDSGLLLIGNGSACRKSLRHGRLSIPNSNNEFRPVTLTFESNPDIAKMNQQTKYLVQSSFSSKVIVMDTPPHTHTYTRSTAIPGPLRRPVTTTERRRR